MFVAEDFLASYCKPTWATGTIIAIAFNSSYYGVARIYSGGSELKRIVIGSFISSTEVKRMKSFVNAFRDSTILSFHLQLSTVDKNLSSQKWRSGFVILKDSGTEESLECRWSCYIHRSRHIARIAYLKSVLL
jgi:hypothetical protein